MEGEEIPRCEPYDWDWDNFEPTKDKLQNMVYEGSLLYHPEPRTVSVRKENVKDPLRKYKMQH